MDLILVRSLNRMSKTLYTHISKLYTMANGVRIREQLKDAGMIENAWMLVEDGKFLEIGTGEKISNDTEVVDLKGQIVIPGFVDAHTHLVYGGSRTNEYTAKIEGKSYLEILQEGGGILSSVKATRAASFEELYDKAYQTMNEMLACGVTSLEAKSGYGLNIETEMKQLRVLAELSKNHPINCVKTYMPAHALPNEYTNKLEYLEKMSECLSEIVDNDLAEFMDCFLEKGIFDVAESEFILRKAMDQGLKVKIHVDEMESIGGVDLGVKLHATSLEHLMVTSTEDAKKMADHQIVGVLLPATSFNLCKPYAHARMMIDQGVILAVASDYNPGSCPCSDFLWMLRIASRGLRVTPNEVLAMATINAAKAIHAEMTVGSIEHGKQADFVVMDTPSFDEVIAVMSNNPIRSVYIKGKRVKPYVN